MILIDRLNNKMRIGSIIPTGFISPTYIIRKTTIDTTPIIRPVLRAELKSEFLVSIGLIVLCLVNGKDKKLE
jgi:hypothetical protein